MEPILNKDYIIYREPEYRKEFPDCTPIAIPLLVITIIILLSIL